MPEKTEIFVVGYYGHRNAGDEVILSAILSGLRKALSGACFTVISHDPEETAAKHGVRAIRWFDPQAVAEATERAHLVVVGGGGLFHDTLGFVPNLLFTKQSWGLGLYVGAALYGSLAQKRVMLWGVGVGPLGSVLAREYTKAACLAADVVTVRDELSKDLLVAAGVPASGIIVTADCAFASKPCDKNAPALGDSIPEQTSPGPRVAVVVREWSVGVCSRDWERQLAEALNKFVRTERGRLVFVPFQTLESEKENDLAVARRIASQLSPRTDVTVLQERLPPQEVKALIAECDLLVGMRLHSIVFAAQAGVPVVALSYDPKVSALMTRLALRHFDCPLRDMQSGPLRDLMTQALEQRSKISVSLRAASEELASETGRNVELACQLMQRPVERKSLPPELVPIVARAIKGQIAAAKQMDERMKFRQAQVEELSACVSKQHADKEKLIEQVRQARESRQQLALMINRRLSVRLRRSLHKLLDISQARTPEPLRRALGGLYRPVYRLLFPSGKGPARD